MLAQVTAALELSEEVQRFGAYAGLASIFGLAVLSLLYFGQARELKRLREWAGRAPERAAELQRQAAAYEEQVVAAQAGRQGAAAGPVRQAGTPLPPRVGPAVPVAAAAGGSVAAAGPGQDTQLLPANGSPKVLGPVREDGTGPLPAIELPTPDGMPAEGPAPAPDGAPSPAPDGAPAAVPAPAAAPAPIGTPSPAPDGAPAAVPAPAAAPAPIGTPAPASAPARAPEAPGAPHQDPSAAPVPAAVPAVAAAAAAPATAYVAGAGAPATAAAGTAPARPSTSGATQPGPASPGGPGGPSRPGPGGNGAPPAGRPPFPAERPVGPVRASAAGASLPPRTAAGAVRARPAGAPPEPERGSRRLLPWIGGGVVALAVAAVLGVTLLGGSDDAGTTAATPAPTGNRLEDPATAPADPEPPLDRSRFSIRVLNGTTIAGVARTVNDRLERRDYTAAAQPTNAAVNNVPTTTVSYSEGNRRAANDIARILGVAQENVVQADEATRVQGGGADVIVTVGADKADG